MFLMMTLTISIQSRGTYNASLEVISANNCRDTASATITIFPLPDVSLTASPDTVALRGETINLTVSGNASSYAWSTGDITNSINVTNAGNIGVLVENDNGCIKELETNVSFIKDLITINEILTPNRDGFNDFMVIKDIESIGPCAVSIYNRWNDLVFFYW